MEYMNKITVITPESFNEFFSENAGAVKIAEDRMLVVTEVFGGTPVRIQIYAPGEWSMVRTELVEIEDDESGDAWDMPEMEL